VSAPWHHKTVLLQEAVDALFAPDEGPDGALNVAPARDGTMVDATFGRGGHSRLILQRLSAQGRLIAFDRDPEALLAAQEIGDPRFQMRRASFSQIAQLPKASVRGLLLDLGVSSPQIDNPARGFSFRGDGPLDMRMDPTQGQSVAQWLVSAPQRQIAEVLRDCGEERFAVQIAKALVARRDEGKPVAGTAELARLVAGAVKTREPGQDPATRTFQAFRIFINAELEELQQALKASLDVLCPGGRLVVISFHSLEDRIVKRFMFEHSREQVDRRSPAWMAAGAPAMKLRGMLRIKPGAAEVAANPRARSAVMRAAYRTDA
jgi:16S rRNA (cytosine1402-N4)-methyltransferase